MTRRHRGSFSIKATWIGVLALLSLFPRLTTAHEAEPLVVARATADRRGITFEPKAAFGEWQLTVEGATRVTITKVLGPGGTLFLPLVDAAGEAFPDGDYRFRLRGPGVPVQFGWFSTSDGRLDARKDHVTVLDQVIPTNLIVQGSTCVGFDCVSGEQFGADTIKLKENNLRIFFDDTSSAAGFPNNDWAIEANDQVSGGANYLGIRDRTSGRLVFQVEAGAPPSALYVDSTGNVGLGTPNPGLELHLVSPDTPAQRLEQTNAGGFAAQTWDVGGNETNFFIRDLTSGSRLPFKIRPGAPTSSIDIAASGNVGINTATPAAQLHVAGGGAAWFEGLLNLKQMAVPTTPAASTADIFHGPEGLRVMFSDGTQPMRVAKGDHTNGGGVMVDGLLRLLHGTGVPTPAVGNVYAWHDSSDGSVKFRFPSGTTAQLTSAGVWTNASSRKFKNQIRALDTKDAVTTLRGLAPVRYFYNGNSDEHVGFVAEDVPELVSTAGREGLSPMDIVAVLTKVVQDQQTRLDDLAKELAALKAALAEVRRK